MGNISSSKREIRSYTERVYGEVRPTASYTFTGAWANATGYTLTIPKTGRYKIKFNGTIRIVANGTNNSGQLRLYNQTLVSAIAGSARGLAVAIGAATSVDMAVNAACEWEENLVAGHVINLQGYVNDVVLVSQLQYTAGATEPLFSYELVNELVPVRNSADDYSTSETDTGKNWIDGKRIYRKVINFGLLPNATFKDVAHGITTLQMVMPGFPRGISYNAVPVIYTLPTPYSPATDSVTLYVNTTNVRAVTYSAGWVAFSAYIEIEYTKV